MAIAGGESSAASLLDDALSAHARGEADAAADLYAAVIEREPAQATALHNLGVLRADQGRADEALGLIHRAIEAEPGTPEAHANLASLLQRSGRLEEARAAYERAVAIKPDFAIALAGLADLATARGDAGEAEALYERALEAEPHLTSALTNFGVLLMARGRPREAGERFALALALQPQSAEATYNVANALKLLGRFEEAQAYFRAALELNPSFADAWTNLGNVLREANDLDGALACHRQAEALRPSSAAVQLNLGHLLRDRGDAAAARAAFARALELDPADPSAALSLCMAELPLMYAEVAEIDACRERYAAALDALIARWRADPRPEAWARAIGASQPFYLAYQGRNDRELQAKYGAFVCEVMRAEFGDADLAPAPAAGGRTRVGVVSGFFSAHSNWKIPIRGWIANLDRKRFEVIGYHTAAKQDAATDEARGLCDRFVQGPLPIEAWRDAILADRPHVLIYPEVGMDPVAVRLAAQRLARLQCSSWGHPDTSGFPTIDAFLSSALMEPDDGDGAYSERLVRLPNLGVWIEPTEAELEPLDRATLGYRDKAVVYWCGQSLPKYLPQFDDLYPRIAQQVGDCQFVFIGLPQASEADGVFKERLVRAFIAHGLDATRHLVFLPRLTKGQFLGAIARADVFLDSPEWSGCNSTLESLTSDLPIVTLRGTLMRGRHTSAILEMMGVREGIAESAGGYVELAVRLGVDAELRKAVGAKIAASKVKLYRDQSAIAALELFITQRLQDPL
ncbi:MAG TPA: tetratricopeptide repeat protein [Caulobacteraceae bacterium]|jgi:predicted O-linked N-acetylglucosamine transferase (SPINDLY family)|nr:tetratricopeptide repeat protein [Caulobacteraceae bacterium]